MKWKACINEVDSIDGTTQQKYQTINYRYKEWVD